MIKFIHIFFLLIPLQLNAVFFYETFDNLLYRIGGDKGFELSAGSGKSWESRNKGLPEKQVYPFEPGHIKKITAYSVNPADENNIIVTTSNELYVTADAGKNWVNIPVSSPVKPSYYFTAAALNPHDKNKILLGTSFSGLFETRDGGRTWTDLSSRMRFMYKGAGFYEEISAVSYDPSDPENIIFASGFGGGLYSLNKTVKEFRLPESMGRTPLYNIHFKKYLNANQKPFNYSWIMEASGRIRSWYFLPKPEIWWEKSSEKTAMAAAWHNRQLTAAEKKRIEKAAGKRGIYLSSWNVSGAELDKRIKFMKENGFNSFVVDIKDDNGIITYGTGLAAPYDVQAVQKRIDLQRIINKAHENGIYVIGRIVVFKDEKLYKYSDGKYALKDRITGKNWGYFVESRTEGSDEVQYVQKEFWVDPFSDFVWDYNIAIAKELEVYGFDEVQFDYIRFPSDGDTSRIKYSHARPGMTRIEALESFLVKARQSLSIPISTDLYGFNSWYRMGNWIGQNIEMFSDYVDAISPMYYPSHFPLSFLPDMKYTDRAGYIYLEGSRRSLEIVDGRAVIRPYIQAFLLGGELKMDEEGYTRYLLKQIEGCDSAGTDGYTLWNASNRYYMVTKPVAEYMGKVPPPLPLKYLD